MLRRSGRQKLIAIAIIVLLVALSGGWWLVHRTGSHQVQSAAAPLSHGEFIHQEDTLIGLLHASGAEASFAYAEKQMAQNSSFAHDCHPLLHDLGHEAYHYYGSFAAAMGHASEICDAGYVHGVVEEYFTSTPHAADAIASSCPAAAAEDLHEWQCFHGLGHGAMLISGEQVDAAIPLCERLSGSFAKGACVNGAFMEEFVVTDHDGGIIADAASRNLSVCGHQSRQYKQDCYFYAPTAFLQQHSARYGDAMSWCKAGEPSYISACMNGIGAESMKDNIARPDIAAQACKAAERKYRDACVSGAISLYIFEHASSEAAAPLCTHEFKPYQTLCTSIIAAEHKALKV